MSRDDEIQAIVEVGRRTRAPVPRSLWIAAAILGAVGTIGLAVALLGEPVQAPAHVQASTRPPPPPPSGAGWGAGLAIGAAGGLIAGSALGRHRAHSSRRRP